MFPPDNYALPVKTKIIAILEFASTEDYVVNSSCAMGRRLL